MGVTGLLPLLKSIQKPCHIRSFKGQTLGFDAYCWLHPGIIPCAIDLALGKQTTRYVDYVMHRIRMLVHYGIKPYVVFDGNYLPSKAGTEAKRAASRAEAKRQGLQLLKLGRMADAHNELQKSIDITPEMARNLMDELQRLNIEYIVAPYEADAQLAYLERKGIIHGILSQDSDLLVFGAKRLITKLDKYGECIEIRRDDFTSCRAASFVGWTDDMFRRMAILAGCDYLPNLKGMGVKTAHSLVRRHKEFDKILRAIQFAGKNSVPEGYAESFKNAEATFLHQWVFCPEKRMLVMSHEWPEDKRPSDISFIGAPLEQEIAIGVAKGDLHPITKLPLLSQRASDAKVGGQQEPRNSNAQSSKALSTPSEKGHKKPIDSFFKPRRTPLAELDPNCFTPSPSQQDLLRRGNGSVLSTPVDENLTPVQSFASIASTGRSTGALRQSRDRLGLPVGASSVPHPSKRQRLSDNSSTKKEGEKQQEVKVVRSKFFGAKAPEPSPSLKRQTRHKHASDAFAIHCDGSAKLESLCLPDSGDEGPERRSKLKVFQEPLQKPMPPLFKTDSSLSASQSDTSSLSASASTPSMTSTQTTAFSFAESQSPVQSQESTDGNVFDEIRSKFTFSATPVNDNAISATVNQTKPRVFRRESALRRLGRQAIHRSQSLPSFGSAVSASSTTGDELLPREGNKAAVAELLPRWNKSTEDDTTRNATEDASLVSAMQGSEDMIVPNSEEEITEQEEATSVSKVNLGRFMFKE